MVGIPLSLLLEVNGLESEVEGSGDAEGRRRRRGRRDASRVRNRGPYWDDGIRRDILTSAESRRRNTELGEECREGGRGKRTRLPGNRRRGG